MEAATRACYESNEKDPTQNPKPCGKAWAPSQDRVDLVQARSNLGRKIARLYRSLFWRGPGVCSATLEDVSGLRLYTNLHLPRKARGPQKGLSTWNLPVCTYTRKQA